MKKMTGQVGRLLSPTPKGKANLDLSVITDMGSDVDGDIKGSEEGAGFFDNADDGGGDEDDGDDCRDLERVDSVINLHDILTRKASRFENVNPLRTNPLHAKPSPASPTAAL
jgi:hypothetical protein